MSRATVFSSVTLMIVISGIFSGCDEQQIGRIDRIVTDANDVVSGVGAVLKSPAGAMLPPGLQLYGAIAVAIASVGVNAWQKIKGDLMKKTAKAIVKGIELAERELEPNPKSKIKEAIGTEMKLAGVYDRGNKLVDQLKVAR